MSPPYLSLSLRRSWCVPLCYPPLAADCPSRAAGNLQGSPGDVGQPLIPEHFPQNHVGPRAPGYEHDEGYADGSMLCPAAPVTQQIEHVQEVKAHC